MVDVVAALIWNGDKFMICQRPQTKSRGLLWEFVGGKVEKGELKEMALIRECKEELNIEIKPTSVFCELDHEYPDVTIHLTLFNAIIISGTPELLEHKDLKWIKSNEINQYEFCPADSEILKKLQLLTLQFRKARKDDIDVIDSIYEFARQSMKINGNPNQWGDYYPWREIILEDIRDNTLYVVEYEGRICATFVYFCGNEPYYDIIDGSWLNDSNYSVVHRVASNGTVKGILGLIMDYCKKTSDNIKIDTHNDNKIMQHLLEKNGFINCGKVIIENGAEHLAYQYSKRK